MASPGQRQGGAPGPPARAAPRRAAPARPAGLPLPSREKPAPLLRAREEEGTAGKRESETSWVCKRGGRSQCPRPGRRLRAPPAPRLGPAGGNKWAEAAEAAPPRPGAAACLGQGREAGKERPAPRCRAPEGGRGGYSITAIVLSLSLYGPRKIRTRYISRRIRFRARLATVVASAAGIISKNLLRCKNKSKTQAELQCPYVKNLFISNCA